MDPCGAYNIFDGWIYVPPKDIKSRYLISYIAHELGHYVDNRSLTEKQDRNLTISLIVREIFGISDRYIIAAERRAWAYGQQILSSLGLLTKEEKKRLSIAKKYCLRAYEGQKLPPESKWK